MWHSKARLTQHRSSTPRNLFHLIDLAATKLLQKNIGKLSHSKDESWSYKEFLEVGKKVDELSVAKRERTLGFWSVKTKRKGDWVFKGGCWAQASKQKFIYWFFCKLNQHEDWWIEK